MNPITIPNITIPVIGLPAIGIPSVGFPSASGGGLAWPAGLKESIKAIYDPAKQGMTNYDVIEAYVEDFTTWNYLSSRGSATVTKNKIIITKSFGNTQNIIEDNKSPYDDIKIYVTGISEDNPLTINQYVDNKWVRLHTYTTDGIYIVENRNLYVGFGTYTTDDCNITITQLPTSILKDLSGNGNHAYLYGGKGKLNSGMGVYNEDFLTFMVQGGINSPNATFYSNKVIIDNIKGKTNFWKDINNAPIGKVTYPSYKIRVSGLPENSNIKIEIRHGDDYSQVISIYAINNEIITIPEVTANVITPNKNYNYFNLVLYSIESIITIEQIPDYPDQLCYDGKMYAVCYGFPILTDYTVMAERTWFENEGNRVFITKGNIGPNCAFVFEKINASLGSETFSFSKSTNIDDLIGKSGITYQTKQSYNGKIIGVGTSSDGDILLIGGQLKGEYIGCHGKIIIADRSFTEDEITWLKDNWKKI